jgi:prephenate dehydratase
MSTPPETTGGLPRVGYLGPAGTFSEEALLASVAPGVVEPCPQATIYDSVLALRRGSVRWALVPIENSLEGSINVTLDLLAEDAGEERIVGEVLLAVHHCLIAAPGAELGEIETVLTHPQVPGQCTRFLRTELPDAQIEAASSTAEAVRMVAGGGRPGVAALGTALAASLYGANVLRAGVEDNEHNETRFVWLAREDERSAAPVLRSSASPEWKTSIVFQGLRAERPGGLVGCLDEFSRREINLTKIESRPRRERMGSYMFFVDLAGRAQEQRLGDAIAGVSTLCEDVRVLGSYPAAPRPLPAAP